MTTVEEPVVVDAPWPNEGVVSRSNHPDHPEAWFSYHNKPCAACGRITHWRSFQRDFVSGMVPNDAPHVCSDLCLFRLTLEGYL